MSFQSINDVPWIPILLGLTLAGHGYRKKSLSPSGAVAAFLAGSIMMSVPLRTFGISLISFYLIGSRATKVGKQLKAKLEEGHQEAGYRTATQVICNAFSAFVASVMWSALFVENSVASAVLPKSFGLEDYVIIYAPESWCALSAGLADGWSRRLIFVTLGHFACCLGDTLASELGILSRSSPLLITTFKRVPPGTNGGVSLLGLFASLSGGVIMGAIMSASLIWENLRCRDVWTSLVSDLLIWGAIGGLGGSLIDSLLGATVQQTRFSSKTKRILQDETVVSRQDSSLIQVISGFNLLTNNQVNLVSSIATALVIGYFA